jgi:hypothetical protein
MLTQSDLDSMRADLSAIRADNAFDVVLRRNDADLQAQNVRVAGGSAGGRMQGVKIDERIATIVLLGDPDMDVQIGDRFTLHDTLFQVTFVRPDRRTAAMVSAQAVE